MPEQTHLQRIIEERHAELVDAWIGELKASRFYRQQLMVEADLRRQCERFLGLLRDCLKENGTGENLDADTWDPMRRQLSETAYSLNQLGYTPAEATGFILLLKRPLFEMLAERLDRQDGELVSAIWEATHLLDKLGLWGADVVHQRQRETIDRQRQEMMELSTPVVMLWEGILALPLIGTLDSARAQVVMESLLERIVATRADMVIVDITGVPTVDTMVAQHLLKAATAARLMGTECIISGIRPQIAQTMVQLGIDLQSVSTKATLADALQSALERLGLRMETAGNGNSATRPGGMTRRYENVE